MPITDFRGEASVRTLARRIYGLGSSAHDKAATERAEAALKAANPALTEPGKLGHGTPVVVPPLAGLPPAGEPRNPGSCLSRTLALPAALATKA